MEQSKTQFRKALGYLILTGFFTFLISGWAGQRLAESDVFNIQYHEIIKGVLLSGILIPVLLLIHKYVYQNKPLGVWVNRERIFKDFFRGVILVLIPMSLSILISYAVGWSDITFHFNSSIFLSMGIGVIGVFIYQALPEEVLFRGYIYGLIATKKGKLISAAMTVLIFVIVPVTSHLVQTNLIGMAGDLGGSSSIQPGYIITLTLFGSFMMFLRISTGSIWITMGFHLMFVFMNQLISPTSSSLIEMSDGSDGSATQITLIVSFLLMMAYVVWKSLKDKNNKATEIVYPKTSH